MVHHLCVLSTYLNKTSWCEYLLVESNIINIFFWRGLPSKLMIFVNLNQANDSVCVCFFFGGILRARCGEKHLAWRSFLKCLTDHGF